MDKKIYLKRLQITNFKGVRALTVNFNQNETIICGENGTGKTTIMDAFLWCLFGKDSTGRSDSNFSIKTWDANKNPILHLDHEVTATLLVNNDEVTLKRCYREKWGIGNNEGKLLNHFTDYYKNDVKLDTKKAYDAEVSSIIPEDIFKIITSPTYFPNLPGETQKAMLLDMAGTISDNEIAALKPEYLELLSQLKGTPLLQFKKEISAKKRAINDELSGIPGRIDEVSRSIPEAEDWKDLEKELKLKQNKVAAIDKQLSDKSKLMEAEYQRKAEIQKQIGEKKLKRSEIENNIRSSATDANNKGRSAIRDLDYKIQSLERENNRNNSDIQSLDENIGSITRTLDTLRAEYKHINASQLVYPDGAFVCPTCKRPLEPDDIEAKQSEMQDNFNLQKANKLKENQATGKRTKNKLIELQNEKDSLLIKIKDNEKEILSLQGQKKYQEENLPAAQNANEMIEKDSAWIALGNEISELENKLTFNTSSDDDTDLRSDKEQLTNNIDELKLRLTKRSQIERANKRISELEEQRSNSNQALADLEKQEYTITEFQKAKDAELMRRINGMFKLVSFTFTSDQLNGNEKINCIMWVNNAPYADANSAGRINAGLDIINAICNTKGITAPIFIDNRERVNKLIPTLSQIINLKVSNDPKLMIKDNNEFKEI